ncbi:MAG: serine hydrolase [Pseudomonadota bacterium]
MNAKVKLFLGLGLLSLAAAPSRAEPADPAKLSLSAGYKAAFTCSALFNAGRSVDEIGDDELGRIRPTYAEGMPGLPDAVVDAQNKRVSVAYSNAFPPRVAQWRPHLGCVQLPSGGGDAALAAPPEANVKMNRKQVIPLAEDLSDNEDLLGVVDAAFDRQTYGEGTETTAVIVMKDGAIIAERYRDEFDKDTPQRTWSVAKSIAASVIGAAVHQGLIDVDEPAGLEAWSASGDPRGAITVENLLHMASGLDNGPAGNRTDDVYFGGGRVIDHAVTRRLIAAPGSRWYYANNDTMLAIRALRERMDDDAAFLAFPFEALLHPIGMMRTFPETDWNGDFILSSQVWTTARDLARLGQLYLNDGVWDGRRILPEGWADFVAAPAPAQPPLTRSDGSPYAGYGAQFWLFGERHGLPDGAYAAMGNRGQYVMIEPQSGLVIVRRGFDSNQPGGARFDIAQFSVNVLAALEE